MGDLFDELKSYRLVEVQERVAFARQDIYNAPRTVMIPKGTTLSARPILGVRDHYDITTSKGTRIANVPDSWLVLK